MITIILTVIEVNARRNGEAICNGFNVNTTNLPALTGSTKQIAWAETIRNKAINEMARFVAKQVKLISGDMYAGAAMDDLVSTINTALANAAPMIAARTAASWWIDNRDCDAMGLAVALTK